MRKAPVLAALLAAALAVPATAQTTLTVRAGIDLWQSATGSAIVFADNPIPAGTFCAGSPAFAGQIPVTGRRIAANQNLGYTDTILVRPSDLTLTVGGQAAQTSLMMQVLSVVGTYSACGVTWNVDAFADPDTQPASTISIKATSSTGGTFDATLNVAGTVRFVSSLGTVLLKDDVKLVTTGACWATSSRNAVKATSPVKVDSDADGVLDLTLLGTSNFHAGWCPGTGTNPPTAQIVTHTGPHPVKPPPPCAIATALTESDNSRAVALPACPIAEPVEMIEPIKVIEVSQQF